MQSHNIKPISSDRYYECWPFEFLFQEFGQRIVNHVMQEKAVTDSFDEASHK